jgi:hypothetical protein
MRAGVIDELRAMGLEDEDAWIEELERRLAAGPEFQIPGDELGPGRPRPLATERTQFGRPPLAPSPSYIAGT